jgi:hypothetical protein
MSATSHRLARTAARAPRVVALAALVAVLFGTAGCDLFFYDLFLCKLTTDARDRNLPRCQAILNKVPRSRAAAAAAPRTDEFSFNGGTTDTRPNGRRATVPVELRPSFRLETTIGLCDPAFAPDAGATFGVALGDGYDGDGWSSIALSVNAGLDATPSFGTGTKKSFPGATRLDLAFEHDGTELVAYARDPMVSAAWQELSRATVAAPSGFFVAEFWARDLQPGAMTTVSSLTFVSNGSVPDGATFGQRAVRALADASGPVVQANALLGSTSGDSAAIAALLAAARLRLDDAVTTLDTYTPGAKKTAEEKAVAKARRSLTKAAAGLDAAARILEKKGFAKSAAARKKTAAALAALAGAADLVLPADTRAAIGGLRLADLLPK